MSIVRTKSPDQDQDTPTELVENLLQIQVA